MKLLGYQVIKARGIAFTDSQKVKVKGSEVGYSLGKIEKILAMHPEQKKIVLDQMGLMSIKLQLVRNQTQIIAGVGQKETGRQKNTTDIFLKPHQQTENINPALLKKKKSKRKKLSL